MLNLRCEGIELWGNSMTLRRWRRTKRFLEQFEMENRIILDCGGWNRFGFEMSRALDASYFSTDGDLNSPLWRAKRLAYDTVFCFEILEHLINPGSFLERLKAFIFTDADVFISIPRRPRFLWPNTHFHEFSDTAFKTLLHETGYEILNHEQYNLWHDWKFYFTGIRPLIRLALNVCGVRMFHLYRVRLVSMDADVVAPLAPGVPGIR